MRDMRELRNSREETIGLLGIWFAVTLATLLIAAAFYAQDGRLSAEQHAQALPATSDLIRIDADRYIIRDPSLEAFEVCRGAEDSVTDQRTIPDFEDAVYVECTYDQEWGVPDEERISYGEALLTTPQQPWFFGLFGFALLAWIVAAIPMHYVPAAKLKRADRKRRKIEAAKTREAEQAAEIKRLEAEIEAMRWK